ncbi:MAG: LD-carboxypeptidase [Bacteroidales bacterium]|nr:LD-carboxypeptidase [Bacteroidales bacterium]
MNKRVSILILALMACGTFCGNAMRPYKAPTEYHIYEIEAPAADTTVVEPLAVDTVAIEVAAVDTVQADTVEVWTRPDIRPEPLRPGDTIGIFAISNYADSTALKYGISVFKNWGLNVKLADNLFKRIGKSRYDGSVEERIDAMQAMLDNPSIKALISVRGGYGAALVTPYLDYSRLLENPKWIVGYSDVTALHITLNNMGLETIHGPMATRIEGDTTSVAFLHDALFGDAPGLSIPTNLYCREGEATGRLVGGNLSLIYSLQGTPMNLDMKDAILFIEDVDEDSYAIDRMLQNLLLSGKLDEIAGIIVGQFSNFDDAKGMDLSLPELIYSKIGNRQIPVMYQIDAGHEWNAHKSAPNYSLYLGRRIHLKVDRNRASFEYID